MAGLFYVVAGFVGLYRVIRSEVAAEFGMHERGVKTTSVPPDLQISECAGLRALHVQQGPADTATRERQRGTYQLAMVIVEPGVSPGRSCDYVQ